ncbi:MAG: hypothetical protein QXL94_00075 [Candidatus Parvarchaeum sp.]
MTTDNGYHPQVYDQIAISTVGYSYTTGQPVLVSSSAVLSTTQIAYNFLYANNLALPNPVPNANTSKNGYVGIFALNSLDFVIDRLVINNSSTAAATVNLFVAYPFSNLVPVITLTPISMAPQSTIFLSKDEYDIVLHTGIVASQSLVGGTVNTVTGYGLGANATQKGVQINGWGYYVRGE